MRAARDRIETRVALLLDEYRHFFTDPAALGAQLDCLVSMHGREKISEWKALAAAGEWPALVARLLEDHYDAAYRRSAAHNFPRLDAQRRSCTSIQQIMRPSRSSPGRLAGA